MAASLWWDDPQTTTKSDPKNSLDDLLVFGYACKIFRDDDKAIDIDKGKLLIPWMGDERLMIDRYDGRGHLYDLVSHDSENANKNPVLTEEEEAIEKACDEERYLELHTDVREAQIYEEEEWKRYYLSLQEGYKAVGFSYDEQNGEENEEVAFRETVKEDDEKPFVPSPELQLPADMHLPTCVKQNARIEKTASFIAQHGIQMEIMLKTKQAGNSQFDFLHFENELNPYYKHMVQMIKSGKYKPAMEEEETKKAEEEEGNHSYLHPSLSSNTATQLPPPPPPPSKPIELPKVSIHDTPYGALIKSIRQNTESSRLAALQAQSYQMAYNNEYQEQMMYMYHNNPPPPGTETVTLPMVTSLSGQSLVDQLYSQPLPPGTEDEYGETQPAVKEKGKKKRSHSSDSSSSTSSSSTSNSSRSSNRNKKSSKNATPSKGQARAQGPNQIQAPPPDVEPIVDRMAMYVAKNGAEFETVVMSRNDPRFQFLNEFHVYHLYYKMKKDKYIQDFVKAANEANEGDTSEDKSAQNLQRSVSFSIKPRPKDQEGGQQPGKPWLFEYDSSEGEDDKQRDQLCENLSGTVTPTAKVVQDEDSQKELEEKLKDKLTSAMKERISQSHKEKQVQMERKRKAAMFLNLIKTNQPSGPMPTIITDDSAPLYVGEGVSNPLVYEYDNQPFPQVMAKPDRSSSKSKKRRRRSPTPPSAYNLERRSPSRPTPPRWPVRPAPWSSLRERTPPWQRRNREMAFRRSRSRSPNRKEDKRNKYKRSKSRTPPRRERNKEESRHAKDKHKTKEKKKEKRRHRSRDRDQARPMKTDQGVEDGSGSDVEILDKSPDSRAFNNRTAAGNVKNRSIFKSESTDDLIESVSRTTSQGNSPAPLADISRSSTPSRSSTDNTSIASSDLMSKVRAMLKKSRELIRKEEGFSLEDT
ncbi:splicing factor, suppressor of white-apricot [Biomphalaria glabrata]|nr:splicing factor, suppressor of white-apricot [Biomphalaria glabrata]